MPSPSFGEVESSPLTWSSGQGTACSPWRRTGRRRPTSESALASVRFGPDQTGSMSEPLRVDVWSDVVCPWCYIGKRNLETGIRAFEEAEGSVPVEVEFHSFQLDPNTPDDFEGSAAEYLARHVGVDVETARQMQRQVSHVAAAVGLHYDFDSLKPANTLKAHQLLHLAKAHGLQLEVKEALMRAHFVEGRHVGRTEELVQIGAAAGLPAEETASSLERQEYLEAVRNDL